MSFSATTVLLLVAWGFASASLDLEPRVEVNLSRSSNGSHNHDESPHGIHVAAWNYEEVKGPLIITCLALIIAIFKIAFHHAGKLSEYIPESCILIIVGVLIGLFFKFIHASYAIQFLNFDKQRFFLFLLPPIILESAFSLRDKAFYENLGTILLYAVFGTILNIALLGIILFCCIQMNFFPLDVRPLDVLIFSSLISAVDPVAVLAIFQEVGVNKMLYFMVFGESLLNDAVTIVLYNMMVAFLETEYIGIKELSLGVAAFMSVAFGAMIIGIVCGFFTAFVTKYTRNIRVVEPLMLFGMAYLSYILAEMVHFSGIISIICCGMIQCQYANENISSKSFISVHYMSKVMSTVTEALIFIILGVELVISDHHWNTQFTLLSLSLCVLIRFVVVYLLAAVVNKREEGIRTISNHEQFIMAYGGLRGAISFSLVHMLSVTLVPCKNMLLTTTITIILFTVFALGITIKPLVKFLRIKTQTKDVSIFRELNVAMADNVTSGMEVILGHFGTHYVVTLIKYLSQHFLRPAVQSMPHKKGTSIVAAYHEMSMQHKFDSQDPYQKQSTYVVSKELKSYDHAGLPASASQLFLDAEDRLLPTEATPVKKRKIPKPVEPLRFDNPDVVLTILDSLRSPLYKTMMFKDFDRNLKESASTENFQRMRNIVSHRLAPKRKSSKLQLPTAQAAVCAATATLVPFLPLSSVAEVTTERDTPRIEVSPPPIETTSFSFGSDLTARYADETHRDSTRREDGSVPERKPLFTLTSDEEAEA